MNIPSHTPPHIIKASLFTGEALCPPTHDEKWGEKQTGVNQLQYAIPRLTGLNMMLFHTRVQRFFGGSLRHLVRWQAGVGAGTDGALGCGQRWRLGAAPKSVFFQLFLGGPVVPLAF